MMRRVLKSFGRLDRSFSELHAPETVDELRRVLERARTENRRVTFRGGGYSFDAQSLNDDIVVSLGMLNRIGDVDVGRQQATVQPGARWQDVVTRLLPFGLIPFSLVTTGLATAGGTMSADCLSRCSPVYGKDGAHVARFQLLATNGTLFECSREQNADLFHAVIGGFGYLGVVTEVTYSLLRIGTRTHVETTIEKHESFDDLIPALIERTHAPEGWNAIYAVAFASGRQDKGLVLRSRYSDATTLRPLPIYRANDPLRVPLEWLVRFPAISNLAWNLSFALYLREGATYVDDLLGYTFFVDGNRIAKETAERFGLNLTTIQQTFVVPEANTRAFLNEVSRTLRTYHLSPILFDILYVPADDFVLSASRGLAGFAISIAFEHLTYDQIAILRHELEVLSGVCDQLGGRVHLVKNVHATPAQLARMYGAALPEFLALKKRLDPEGILRNGFFERVFGCAAAG